MLRPVLLRLLLIAGCAAPIASPASGQVYPTAPVPAENPITESKRVLGKILFWDEQLSSDNTVACGTCHIPSAGGSDPRTAGHHPGPDGLYGEVGFDDDILGSLGVIASGPDLAYEPDPIFDFAPQVTPRTTQPAVGAEWFFEQFWDGRASGDFVDPESGEQRIDGLGALETQALAPILSAIEMGHAGRTWADVRAKLAVARPLMLGSDLPPDVQSALDTHPSYPALFADAFGDDAITAERIAYAIATYERTLVPDQTPWDRFMAGDARALTKKQQIGLELFMGPANCHRCHTPPLFTDLGFHNLGVRPIEEDPGRANVTGLDADRGKFKTPSLRNVALRPRGLHNGQMPRVSRADVGNEGSFGVIPFYFFAGGPFEENRDPILVNLEENGLNHVILRDLVDFIEFGLIDPRVAAETFPFDRPALHSDGEPNPSVSGAGRAGTGGIVPQVIAASPPNLGNLDFRVGVHDALGGAVAWIVMSTTPPAGDALAAEILHGPITLRGGGAGDGYGTWRWPIPLQAPLDGRTYYVQWRIEDPSAVDGFALSEIARLDLFCNGRCPCPLDLTDDRSVGFADLTSVLQRWGNCDACAEDLDRDGLVGFADLMELLSSWGGCSESGSQEL